MGRQPAADPFGFANVTKQPPRLSLISTDQHIDPRPLNLTEGIPHAPQLITAKGDGLNGGHGDLGHLHAVRVAIQKEDID